MTSIEEIKNWLKEHRHTRNWLAEKCFISKGQLDNWLCGSRKIPQAKMAIIEALIEKDRLEPFIQTVNTQKKSFHGIVSVAPQFTGEEWEIVKEAAARRGVDTETFIRESAMQWAKQIQDAKIASDLMAAEDDTRD